MKRYSKVLGDAGSRELICEYPAPSNGELVRIFKHTNYDIEPISLRNFEANEQNIRRIYREKFAQIFRTTNPQQENSFQQEIISRIGNTLYSVDYIPSRGRYQSQDTTLYYLNNELFAWLKDSAELIAGEVVKTNKMSSFWRNEDIPKANLANEGSVDFRRGKKPESLIYTIFNMMTNPGDLVLDSFAGSGTTGAVAHKMGRRWIMIELGEHCHTHIIPRLQKVVDGSDQGGISKAVNWKGGGGFRYYSLAPSLLQKDKYGNWVISKEYNAEMLAEAMCKHEGFHYAPDEAIYWKQGQSTETDFVYTTTQPVTKALVESIADQLGDRETLLICCTSFHTNADEYPQITVKKIPHAVLARCEFGRDDYSLQIKELEYEPRLGQGELWGEGHE